MSVYSKDTKEKSNVSLPLIIGAAVLLVVFVGWLAYANFAPTRPDTGTLAESKNDWVSQIAKESGGDINKVDPQTRQKLDIFTGGKGEELLKAKYKAATK